MLVLRKQHAFGIIASLAWGVAPMLVSIFSHVLFSH